MKTTRHHHRHAHLDAAEAWPDANLPQRRTEAEADRLLALLDEISTDEKPTPNKPTTPYEQ